MSHTHSLQNIVGLILLTDALPVSMLDAAKPSGTVFMVTLFMVWAAWTVQWTVQIKGWKAEQPCAGMSSRLFLSMICLGVEAGTSTAQGTAMP